MKKAWNKLDLTGQRFGNLLVVEEVPKPEDFSGKDWKVRWRCVCDCGNECIKETSKLRNQGSICCPECAKQLVWKDRKEDLTGMTFGQLTVIKETDPPDTVDTTKKKRRYWECKCSCGEKSVVTTASLKNGKTTMCWTCAHYVTNSYKRKDYTGQTFGELTILEMIYPDRNIDGKRRTKCRCKCSCGNEVVRDIDNIVQSKYRQSCGCVKNKTMAEVFGRDIVGQKFGKLLVEKVYYKKDGYDKPMVKCLCDCGNEVMLVKNDVQSFHTLSCGCSIASSYEIMTESILNELGLHYITQYSFDECIYKHKLRFDFAVIDDQNNIKFLIENDGKQHFEPIEFYGGQEGFEIIQKRDKIKDDYCKESNLTLLRLPYYLNKEQIKNEIKKVI